MSDVTVAYLYEASEDLKRAMGECSELHLVKQMLEMRIVINCIIMELEREND